MRGEKIHVENERCARAILGANLRTWRKSRELPLKSVAYESDICIETVSAWEAGDHFLLGVNLKSSLNVSFEPASPNRLYRLQYCDGLASGIWHYAGEAPRAGIGAIDALTDDSPEPPAQGRRFYRVKVEVLE